jgi:hypothetical protein
MQKSAAKSVTEPTDQGSNSQAAPGEDEATSRPSSGSAARSTSLGADAEYVRGKWGSRGQQAQQESSSRQHTRGESPRNRHASDQGSSSGVQSAASPRTLAKHEDNSSGRGLEASDGGSAYTRRQRTRRERWELLETLWSESSVDRCRACRRWRADRTKGYQVCTETFDDPDGDGEHTSAYISNIQTCRSSWGCPVCAAKIRQKRAKQIAKAAARHLEEGGGLEFVMLTMPHDLGDGLDGLLDALKAGWNGITKGYARQKDWEEFGIDHYVRSLDLTWSDRNGWHPHYHVVLFTESPLSKAERRKLQKRWHERWADRIEEEGYRRTRQAGVRLRPIESESEAYQVGTYSAEGVMISSQEKQKEPDRMEVGWEMTRHDLKKGARSGKTPWDILAQLDWLRRRVGELEKKAQEAGGLSGLSRMARTRLEKVRAGYEKMKGLWQEYEQATKGRRSIQPSRGLWKEYNVTEGELEDEELAEEDHDGEVQAELDPTTMEWVRRVPGGLSALLEAAEDGTYILRTPEGRIEKTGPEAKEAGADAIGLSSYIAAVRDHYRTWRRGG